MRKVITTALLLALICCASLGAYRWYEYKGSPEYSLACLSRAIKTKDYETARFYVDEERLADSTSKSVVSIVVDRMGKEMTNDNNPFSGLGVAIVQAMVPRLQEMAKDKVEQGIKEALTGGETLTGADRNSTDLSRFANVRVSQSVVVGNTAEVVLTGFPQPNPFQLREFRLRMAKIPNTRTWRVVEAPDVAKLVLRAMDEAETPGVTTSTSTLPPEATTAGSSNSQSSHSTASQFRYTRYDGDRVDELCTQESNSKSHGCYKSGWQQWIKSLELQVAGSAAEAIASDSGVESPANIAVQWDDTERILFSGCRPHACPDAEVFFIVAPALREVDIIWMNETGVRYLGPNATLLRTHDAYKWVQSIVNE